MNKYCKGLVFVSIFVLTIFSSCSDSVPPKATVTVRNGMENNGIEMNVLLESALVTIFIDPNTGKPGYVDPDGKVDVIQKNTDASGQCSFDFVQENILQVKAEYPLNGDTLYGEGVVVLKEDETYQETIYLRKYKSQL